MYRLGKRLCSLEPHLVELLFRNYRRVARTPVKVHMPSVSEAERTLKYYEEHVSKNKLGYEGERDKKTAVKDRVSKLGDEGKGKKKSAEGDSSQLHSSKGSKWERVSALCGSTAEITSGKNDLIHGIQYNHFSDAKDYIRALLKNSKSRKFRDEHKLFAVEGFRIIKEALDVGLTPEAIFFTRLPQLLQLKCGSSSLGLKELKALNDLPLYRIPYKTLQTWSSLTTCPGILGIFKHQESSRNYPMPDKSLPVTVILDQVREPGNVGGILRTLASVGVENVILMKGCCDPWDPKVLRAGSGAHFRLKLTSKVCWNVLGNHVPESAPILIADVCRGADPDRDASADEEPHGGNGLRKCDEESVRTYEVDGEGNRTYVDPSYDDEEHLSNFRSVRLPLKLYDEVEVFRGVSVSNADAFIIIGGETGISSAAKKFAYVSGGLQVTIPLVKDMDSLNTSVAVGIILYEIRRQFRQRMSQS